MNPEQPQPGDSADRTGTEPQPGGRADEWARYARPSSSHDGSTSAVKRHSDLIDLDKRADTAPAGRSSDDIEIIGDRDTDRQSLSSDDIEVITGGEDLGIFRAHRRYGGFDLGASLAGMLAAFGMTALLGGLAGALGTVGYQLDVERNSERLSTGGFIGGLVVILASFLVGGWVAGRVARYDGGRNGATAAGFFVILTAALAGLGAWAGDKYNVTADIRAPQWFTSQATTTAAVLSAIVAVVVAIAAGWMGGALGSRYHRKADRYLAEYAEGTARSGDTADAGRSVRPATSSRRQARRVQHG